MAVSLSEVERLAPDQASLEAARKLLRPAGWPLLAVDADGRLAWGECQGSGSAPYRLVADLGDFGHKCTCPSRKFPCKHVLALLWQRAQAPERFAAGTPPDWVADWLSRRRPKADGPAGAAPPAAEATPPPANDIAATLADGLEPGRDEGTEARAAQRERQRAAREASVLAGLGELERWVADQLDRGLAAFPAVVAQQCRLAARRLVDAKAPGIATLLDELPGELFALPEPMRPDFLLDRLGGLVLLSQAYRRQDALPDPLRQDVRRLVGWSQRREELLGDAAALRVTGVWLVAGSRVEAQADGLLRVETWLVRGDAADPPDRALVLDFQPAAAGAAAVPFRAGEWFHGTLVFYPSACPLRALVAERVVIEADPVWPAETHGLAEELALYRQGLAAQPWLGRWPLRAGGTVVVEDAAGQMWLVGGDGSGLPLLAKQADDLLPLLNRPGLSAVALWDGYFARLLTADTPFGRWHDA